MSPFSFSPVRHQGRSEHKAEDKEDGSRALLSSWPPERPFLELLFKVSSTHGQFLALTLNNDKFIFKSAAIKYNGLFIFYALSHI